MGHSQSANRESQIGDGFSPGQLIQLLLLLALEIAIIGAAGFLVEAVERIAVAGGEQKVAPDLVHIEAGFLQGGGAFLKAEFEDIAPGAGAEEGEGLGASGEFVAKRGPAGGEFLSGGLDAGGGLLAGAQSEDVMLLGFLFFLFAKDADRLKGKAERLHKEKAETSNLGR
jgi:hypothetical protein